MKEKMINIKAVLKATIMDLQSFVRDFELTGKDYNLMFLNNLLKRLIELKESVLTEEDAESLFRIAEIGARHIYPFDGETRRSVLKWFSELKQKRSKK